ncbi:MAG TPA: SDR family oxidoreductase [Aggregatilineales bacterium]|nr:SDR family oxidoreductase [Anaerolineales bacterium]HRE48739.1 SDR family oxidoreductase [Aggregatilineales bacterium]
MTTLSGKTVLITGATNGIGKQTALELAKQGATVVIVGRNSERTQAVIAEIKTVTNNPNIEGLIGDLSLIADVHRLADEFKARHDRLHILINNAGGIFFQREETSEGHEMTFALNHLSYFLLTNLLLDMLQASAPARIINVSSDAHQMGKIDFEDIELKKAYAAFAAYGRSKLMNIYFTYELARRLKESGVRGVTVNALHPGFVRTGFWHNTPNGFIKGVMGVLQRFGLTVEKGAETSVYLATSPEVEDVSGKYFEKKKAKPSVKGSYEKDEWARLWTVSAEITGLAVPEMVS